MGRTLRSALVVVEGVITFFTLIPTLLWLLLNFYYVKYKISRNRKRMIKALKREGLSEPVSIRIAEHIFPKIELSPWQFSSFFRKGEYGEERGKPVGKQDR